MDEMVEGAEQEDAPLEYLKGSHDCGVLEEGGGREVSRSRSFIITADILVVRTVLHNHRLLRVSHPLHSEIGRVNGVDN